MCQAALLYKIIFHKHFSKTSFSNNQNINASKISEYYSIIYIQNHGKRDAQKHH